MRAALLALLVAAEVAAAPRVLNRLAPYPRLDRRDRLGATSPYYATILADSYALPGGECSGQTLQTSLSANITWSRASSAWCSKSDGTHVLLSSNQPRASTVGGSPSVLVEGTRTNIVLQNRDLSSASWTATSISCVKDATGVDGVSSSASTCTASGSNGKAQQALSATSGAYVVSAFIKRVTGSGTVELTADGTTFTALSSSNCRKTSDFSAAAPSSSYWVRCAVAQGSVTAFSPAVRLATSGDAVAVDLFQLEAGGMASSPITTTSTSAARATEVGSLAVPAAFSNTLGCARMGVMPLYTGAPPTTYFRALSRGNNTGYFLGLAQTGDNWGAYDSANLPSVAAGYTAFTRKGYATRWDKPANLLRVENLSAGTGSQSAFSAWGTDGTLYVGAEGTSGTYPVWGYINNVGFASTYAGCVL